jgi:hypothetical protein
LLLSHIYIYNYFFGANERRFIAEKRPTHIRDSSATYSLHFHLWCHYCSIIKKSGETLIPTHKISPTHSELDQNLP